jgi:hypothetical protein
LHQVRSADQRADDDDGDAAHSAYLDPARRAHHEEPGRGTDGHRQKNQQNSGHGPGEQRTTPPQHAFGELAEPRITHPSRDRSPRHERAVGDHGMAEVDVHDEQHAQVEGGCDGQCDAEGAPPGQREEDGELEGHGEPVCEFPRDAPIVVGDPLGKPVRPVLGHEREHVIASGGLTVERQPTRPELRQRRSEEPPADEETEQAQRPLFLCRRCGPLVSPRID